MDRKNIRVTAVAAIYNGDKVLANGCHDPKSCQTFFLLPGGGVEFGEKSIDALKRELLEEIGEEIENIKFIKVTEGVFEFNGKIGHEIIFLYECELVNKSLYKKDKIDMLEKEHAGKYFEWIVPNDNTPHLK